MMDELADAFGGAFKVNNIENDVNAPHPRYSQYKSKITGSSQKERRKRILEIQKQNRFDSLVHVRRLAQGKWDDMPDHDDDSMEVDNYIRHTRPGKNYKNQLMLSEWLVEVPEDLETEWIMEMCPIGKRCLVITTRGQTIAYAKSGLYINSFPSNLPGGSKRKGVKYTEEESTILDCIYNDVTQTYYILDLMCWNGHPVYDSETEFRFFWLLSKMEEYPELDVKSKYNPYKFIALPQIACTKSAMAEAVAQPMLVALDGLLFYHKKARYTFGSTPLVLWLKPYMLPEILGVPATDEQMKRIPSNYVNQSEFIKKFEEKEAKEKEKKQRKYSERKQAKSANKKEPMEVSGNQKQSQQTEITKTANKSKNMSTQTPAKMEGRVQPARSCKTYGRGKPITNKQQFTTYDSVYTDYNFTGWTGGYSLDAASQFTAGQSGSGDARMMARGGGKGGRGGRGSGMDTY
ncbi:snurportin-1-like [Tubulanus polymorphus]|uniref:snurportin-1-like n=1 Tax=Tubulanus polymorphus TaxID=672921 RepID=UPI003DA291D0